ncbi:hypothetical protein PLESTM_001147400 [Pleodorina starrii]|nr:hypothetical protein PLESTM_001147400 [Pleodorina starrii]
MFDLQAISPGSHCASRCSALHRPAFQQQSGGQRPSPGPPKFGCRSGAPPSSNPSCCYSTLKEHWEPQQ